mmetsp:Transcript_17003/g.35689  ORF Transcript_17003/g.35689 Transcript_17003/m.35689 type:complete len:86 (-) Transcript_17003:198-455(-)
MVDFAKSRYVWSFPGPGTFDVCRYIVIIGVDDFIDRTAFSNVLYKGRNRLLFACDKNDMGLYIDRVVDGNKSDGACENASFRSDG